VDRFLKLGTRGSPLALAQAQMTAMALEVEHHWRDGRVETVVIKTSGDKVQDRPLAEIGGKSLWTKELDAALLKGETHASVHSMKDVETERPDTLCLAAVLPRADVRDRLIGADSIDALKQGATVGTSSPRRAAQLLRLRPDLKIVTFRGNLGTRLAKLEAGEVDATLLAAAGLERLGQRNVGVPIPVDVMLPAPGQGAIGIECRSDDNDTHAKLARVNDIYASAAVKAERAFARALGGSCHSPVGAYAEVKSGQVHLRAEILSEDGKDRIADEARFKIGDDRAAEALAKGMLAKAPETIRRLFAAK